MVNDFQPLVSICCITYNHENYIKDAIEGFLVQKTDFPIEIIIRDDASTDKTADIVRLYQAEHPNLISTIFHTKNQYSLGIRPFPEVFMKASGKYIALCEGDDYWTDPLKLQKQVDFLESHPEFAICCHGVTFKYEDERPDHYGGFLRPKRNEYSIRDLCIVGFISTCSTVFRNHLFEEIPQELRNLAMGDWAVHILNAEHGKIWFIDKNMATYRVHGSGVWTRMDPIKKKKKVIEAYFKINKYLGRKYEKEIMTGVWGYWLKIAEISAGQGSYKQARRYYWKCIRNINYKGKFSYNLLIKDFIKIHFPALIKHGTELNV